MSRIFSLSLFAFFSCSFSSLYAQKGIATDSTYLSFQKIENDSVRNSRMLNYAVALLSKKSTKGAELGELMLKNALQTNNEKLAAQVYLSVGGGYLRAGEYDKAYPNFLKALAIYQKKDEPRSLIRVYQNMAWIQIQLNDDGAGETISKGIKIALSNNLKGMQAELYSLQGVYYDSRKQFDKAIAAYEAGLALDEKYTTKYSRTGTYLNLAISLRRSKRYDEALESMLKAKTLAGEVNDRYLLQSAYQNLAELTLDTKDYDNAEKYILLALNNSKDNYELVTRRGLFENLKKVYENKGDYKKSLQYADSATLLTSEVFAKEKVSDVRNLQVKYETALKDEKIATQNLQNKQQQQQLEINQKKLELTLSQKRVDQLNFSHRQQELENQKKIQAGMIQRAGIQAKLDNQISSQKINGQNEKLKSASRMQYFLTALISLTVIISLLIFYNQYKTRQLNKVITLQKKDLEITNSVKDRLFNIIGHDLRSPINTLIAFNHLLEDQDLSGDKVKVYAREIKKTLNQTSVLMENLLNWSSSQMQGYKPQLEKLMLKNITDDVIRSISAQALQKNIQVSNLTEPGITVLADANMTELIVRNILTNAVKFTPPGGEVKLSAVQSEYETLLNIADNGNGMDAGQVLQFNNDQTNYNTVSKSGTNKEKGSGLGLVLCKTFVALMNGKIYVDSAPGSGSVFKVTLPNA